MSHRVYFCLRVNGRIVWDCRRSLGYRVGSLSSSQTSWALHFTRRVSTLRWTLFAESSLLTSWSVDFPFTSSTRSGNGPNISTATYLRETLSDEKKGSPNSLLATIWHPLNKNWRSICWQRQRMKWQCSLALFYRQTTIGIYKDTAEKLFCTSPPGNVQLKHLQLRITTHVHHCIERGCLKLYISYIRVKHAQTTPKTAINATIESFLNL